jgi:transposase
MPTSPTAVIGGIDTHKHLHHAAVLDTAGRLLGHAGFPTSPAGHAALLGWLRGHGQLQAIGVEGTGSYGAGLTRFLVGQRVKVVEVNRQIARTAGPATRPTHWTLSGPPGPCSPRPPTPPDRPTRHPDAGRGHHRPARARPALAYLNHQIKALDTQLAQLLPTTAPNLLALHGVGLEVAGQLLVTAGGNPDRLTSEAAFARLCGVAP